MSPLSQLLSSVPPESAKQSLVVVVKCNELIMITGREACSRVQSVVGRPAAFKLGKAKVRAVAFANSIQPRYTKAGVASLSEMVKPALEGKIRPEAPFKHPGVRGDRAHPNNHQELGRPCLNLGPLTGERTSGSHNRRALRIRESDGLIVAAKSPSSRDGAKEPWPESSRVRGNWS
jgi:hypothetical protein